MSKEGAERKVIVLVPSGKFDPRSLGVMLLTTQGEFKDTFVKVHDKGSLFQELKPENSLIGSSVG